VGLDAYTAGNLRAVFPDAEIVMATRRANFQLGRPPPAQCWIVWEGQGAAVRPLEAAMHAPDRRGAAWSGPCRHRPLAPLRPRDARPDDGVGGAASRPQRAIRPAQFMKRTRKYWSIPRRHAHPLELGFGSGVSANLEPVFRILRIGIRV
jgi:hypothetical protein